MKITPVSTTGSYEIRIWPDDLAGGIWLHGEPVVVGGNWQTRVASSVGCDFSPRVKIEGLGLSSETRGILDALVSMEWNLWREDFARGDLSKHPLTQLIHQLGEKRVEGAINELLSKYQEGRKFLPPC